TALLLGGNIASPVVFVLYALGGAGPTLAALVLRLLGVRSPRMARAGSTVHWLPVEIGCEAVPDVLDAVLAPVLGAPAMPGAVQSVVLADAGGLLLGLSDAIVAGPLSEEFCWRCYLQPRLRSRLTPVVTAVVLCAIWALWHAPLFLLVGTWQSSLGLGAGL